MPTDEAWIEGSPLGSPPRENELLNRSLKGIVPTSLKRRSSLAPDEQRSASGFGPPTDVGSEAGSVLAGRTMPAMPVRDRVSDAEDGPRTPVEARDLRKRLEAALSPEPGVREAEQLAVSGVLLPVILLEEQPLLLLTRRSEDLPAHPGQISYPGGRREPGESPRDTALRETQEETGLPASAVDLIGHLTDYVTHRDDLVCAYAGVVEPPVGLEAPITPEEVTERLLVPLRGLVEGQAAAPSFKQALAEAGERALGTPYPVLGYEARSIAAEGRDQTVHYWHLAEDTTLWGISGELTAQLLSTVLDWQPPTEPRRVDTIEDLPP